MSHQVLLGLSSLVSEVQETKTQVYIFFFKGGGGEVSSYSQFTCLPCRVLALSLASLHSALGRVKTHLHNRGAPHLHNRGAPKRVRECRLLGNSPTSPSTSTSSAFLTDQFPPDLALNPATLTLTLDLASPSELFIHLASWLFSS